MTLTWQARFRSKFEMDADSECWLWTAGKTADGYALFWRNGMQTYGHRVSYEMHSGPIPAGLHLDHLCRVRHCVNPDHLEPVTNFVNNRRGQSFAAQNAAKTKCLRGHLFDTANTYHPKKGGRHCRACRREYNRAYRARKRAGQ